MNQPTAKTTAKSTAQPTAQLTDNRWSDAKVKLYTTIAWILSVVVWALVVAMRELPKLPVPGGIDLSVLPTGHAIINTLVSICLVLALVFVKRGDIRNHQRMMNTALCGSILFLLSYVVYNLTQGDTHFGGTGAIKVIYLLLLITHIILAALSLPFILKAWILGTGMHVEAHRKLVKRLYPIWLYVAITGPVCYLMLRPYYA